jgi:hypothetical protein
MKLTFASILSQFMQVPVVANANAEGNNGRCRAARVPRIKKAPAFGGSFVIVG